MADICEELSKKGCYSTYRPLKRASRAEVPVDMSGCVSLVVESQTKPEKKIRIRNKFLSCLLFYLFDRLHVRVEYSILLHD